MSLYHSHENHKQISKQTSNRAQTRASWSQVEHSTTAAMGKEGIIHEFISFHKGI